MFKRRIFAFRGNFPCERRIKRSRVILQKLNILPSRENSSELKKEFIVYSRKKQKQRGAKGDRAELLPLLSSQTAGT